MRYLLGGLLPALLVSGCVSTDADTQGVRAPLSATDKMARAAHNQGASLKGRIVRQAGTDQYILADGMGEALVRIPAEVARGQALTAGTEVEVRGVVNGRGPGARIDAATVNIVDPSEGSSAFGPGRPVY